MRITSFKTKDLEGKWSNEFRFLNHGGKQASKKEIMFKSIMKSFDKEKTNQI